MMTTDTQQVLFCEIPNEFGAIGLITLNRPDALNAINFDMINAILAQLENWQDNPDIGAVIIEGAGNRAFCAGGDIRSIYDTKQRANLKQSLFFTDEYKINSLIYLYRKPFIALLDGITMGGGAGLSIHGRWRIATDHFIFAMPETGIGFYPDVGAGYFLAHLPFHIGYYLGLTGNRIYATDALALGLIDAIIPHYRLTALRQALLSSHYRNNGDSTVANILARYRAQPKHSDLQLLPKANVIDRYFSAPTIEDIMANLEHDRDPWCQEVLATLQQRSPTSLKVTLQHLHHCASLSFSAVIAEDTYLTNKFLGTHDLYEGIRAMVIDKDRQPHWQPANLDEVTSLQVNSFFGAC